MLRTRRSLFVFACVLVIAIAAPALAHAKSYSMPRVAIRADVQPNGDLNVYEAREYSFDGDYTRVYWSIPTAGTEGIEIVGVKQLTPVQRDLVPTDAADSLDSRPDGYYYVQSGAGTVEVSAYHRSSDEDASFALLYTVKGGVKRYSDCAELYWQAIGDQWEVGVDQVKVEIRPPAEGLTKEDVKAWAHGPLTGVVSINENGMVTLEVSDLPPNTFVEARVLYPPEALPAAPVIDQPRRQQVLDEEAQLADEANAERMQARLFVGGVWGVALLLSVGGITFAFFAWRRHGREFKARFQGQYFREDPRPDLHPAVIGALWKFGTVDDNDIAATLMELADKGVVRMVPATVPKGGMFGGEDETFTLERVPDKEHLATDLDRQLITLLFDKVAGGRPSFYLTDIKAYAKEHAQTFADAVKAWKGSAEALADSMGFFDGDSFGWQVFVFMAAVVTAAFGIFGAVWIGSFWPVLLCIPSAIGQAVFGVLMRRRSAEGNELYRTYVAVRDFLRDFSRLEEAPPTSIILWNRFLVLAVIFGIADEVIAQLRVKLPEVVKDPGFQTSYWWVYAGTYGHSPVTTLSSSFVSASQVASSQLSSSSGGGGGFSGGGGGGFGGGGGGAD